MLEARTKEKPAKNGVKRECQALKSKRGEKGKRREKPRSNRDRPVNENESIALIEGF